MRKPSKDLIKQLVDDLIPNGIKLDLCAEIGITSGTMTKWISGNHETGGPVYNYLSLMRGLATIKPESFYQLDAEVQRHIDSWRKPNRKNGRHADLNILMADLADTYSEISGAWHRNYPRHDLRAAVAIHAAKLIELQEALDAEASHNGVGAGEGDG